MDLYHLRHSCFCFVQVVLILLYAASPDRLQDGAKAESGLDGAHVVLLPVALGGFLLTNGHADPVDTHDSDSVDVVLLELDLHGAEVTSGPLCQTPLLLNVGGLLELGELARDVTTKDLELATLLCAVEDLPIARLLLG